MAKIKKKPTTVYRSWHWESEFDLKTEESLSNLQTKKGFAWVEADWNDLDHLYHKKHMLAVCIRAQLMNETEEWAISTIILPDSPVRVPELEEFYRKHRDELLSEVQRRHIVDVGFVIQTYSNFNQVNNDKWWQVGSIKATKERQELWRYFHNVIKKTDQKVA